MQPKLEKTGLKAPSADLRQELADNGILVVGEISKWTGAGRSLPQTSKVQCIEFHDLTSEMIDLIEPSAVFSPLICASFDCMDVAVMLQKIGYRGRYRAMGASLPNPLLIRAEINQNCPDIDFDFVEFNGQERLN